MDGGEKILMTALDIPMSLRYSPSMPKQIFRKGGQIMKTMIYLDERVHAKLKHIAVDERTSMADLIRRAIELYLETPMKKGGGKK